MLTRDVVGVILRWKVQTLIRRSDYLTKTRLLSIFAMIIPITNVRETRRWMRFVYTLLGDNLHNLWEPYPPIYTYPVFVLLTSRPRYRVVSSPISSSRTHGICIQTSSCILVPRSLLGKHRCVQTVFYIQQTPLVHIAIFGRLFLAIWRRFL